MGGGRKKAGQRECPWSWRLIGLVATAVAGLLWACGQLLAVLQPSCQEQLDAAERRIAELRHLVDDLQQRASGAAHSVEVPAAGQPAPGALRGTKEGAPDEPGPSACLPRSMSSEDAGYVDDHRGWYDVQGCGRCHDYCRWVGDSGPGGDPTERLQVDKSWWSCRLAGTSSAHTDPGHFATWSFAKCSAEGAASGEGDGAMIAPGATSARRITEEQLKEAAASDAVGVVVIVCKRPKYLQRAMESVARAVRDPARFPVVISQDALDPAMTQMVQSTYVDPGVAFHMHHPHDPSAIAVAKTFGGSKASLGYVRIAQHYGFALRKMFDNFGFQQVILLEEDMEISPDFFSYFGAMLPLLRSDRDLYCVSAWNDNGYATLVSDATAAFRTDFFPGLGWMLRRPLWEELRTRWAVGYWDEFMRRPDVRKGRHCIRPEVSRSYTFGQEGTSSGQFFENHLSRIRLNEVPVDWGAEDLRHLASAAAFDKHLTQRLRAAERVELEAVDQHGGARGPLRVEYDDRTSYKAAAEKFSLMPDEKEGIRRMSYRGVIPFSWHEQRVYLYTRDWPGDG